MVRDADGARRRRDRSSRRPGRRRILRRVPRVKRLGAAVDGIARGFARPRVVTRPVRYVLLAIGSERLGGPIARRHRRRLVTPYATAEVADEAGRIGPARSAAMHADPPLRRELLRQSFHTNLPELLRYADRSSMANSREVRLPFLDRSVAGVCALAPGRLRLSRRSHEGRASRRCSERRAGIGRFIGATRSASSRPGAWLAEPARVTRVTDVLLDPGARARSLYRADVIELDARAARWRDPGAIWRALNLELWLRAFEPPGRSAR